MANLFHDTVLDGDAMSDTNEGLWDILIPDLRPQPLPPFLQVLGTEDTYHRRYRVTSKHKDLLLWRKWPVLHILIFCQEADLKKLAIACKLFKNAVYSTLEAIAQYKISHLETHGVMHFINEFALFDKVEEHIAKYDKQSLMVDQHSLLSDDEAWLLYNDLRPALKVNPSGGMTTLAVSKWTNQGYAHFKRYLGVRVLETVDLQKKFVLCFDAWKSILDVFALNFQVIKIRAWSAYIVKDFTMKSVCKPTKSLG